MFRQAWKPTLEDHATFSRVVRSEVVAVLTLAATNVPGGPLRYPRCGMERLPWDLIYYVLEFLAAPRVRDYSTPPGPPQLLHIEDSIPWEDLGWDDHGDQPLGYDDEFFVGFSCLTVNRDGCFVIGHIEGIIVVSVDGRVLSKVQRNARRTTGVCCLPDGSIVCARPHFAEVVVLHPDGTLARKITETSEGEFEFPVSVSSDAKGNIVVADASRGVCVVASDGTWLRNLSMPKYHWTPDSVAVLSNGSIAVQDTSKGLFVSSADGVTRLVGKEEAVFIAADAAGNIVVSHGGSVKVLTEEGTVLWEFHDKDKSFGAVSVLGDGRVAVVHDDRDIWLL